MSSRLSASCGDLDKLACRVPTSPYYSPTSVSGTLPTHTEPIYSSVAALYAELTFAKRQIYILQTENDLFREKQEKFKFTIKLLSVEISILQATLEYTNDTKGSSRLTGPEAGANSRLEKRLADYQKLVRALAEGHVLDPMIIHHTQAEIDQGCDAETALAQAIQVAALDKQSLWSKTLPMLVDGQISQKKIEAVNLALRVYQRLREVQQVARFWKSQALSPSVTSGTHTSDSCLDSIASEGLFENVKPYFTPRTSTSGHPSTFGEFQSNGVVNITTVQSPHRISLAKRHTESIVPDKSGEKLTSRSLRPSMSFGLDANIGGTPLRNQVHPQRMTFHESMSLEARVTQKRHGFVMPCIRSILQKHASAPVSIRSFNSVFQVDDPFEPTVVKPSTDLDLTLMPALRSSDSSVTTRRHSLIPPSELQSVERLCSAFSSGSLGSLEMTLQSESDTDFSLQDTYLSEDIIDEKKPSRALDTLTLNEVDEHGDTKALQAETGQATEISVKQANQITMSEDGHIPSSDATTTTTTPLPQRGFKGAGKGSLTAETRSPKAPLLPVKYLNRARISETYKRTNRVCCGAAPTCVPGAKVSRTRISSNAQCANRASLTKQRRSSTVVTLIPEASLRPNRLVPAASTTGRTTYTPNPRLNLVKSGLAKPAIPARSAKSSISNSGLDSAPDRLVKCSSSPAQSYSAARHCKGSFATPADGTLDVVTSAPDEHSLDNKIRNRLRVVNIGEQDPDLPASPLLSRVQKQNNKALPQFRVKPWSITGFQDGSECTRFDGGGRTATDDPVISNSGVVRGVSRVSENPHIKMQPSS